MCKVIDSKFFPNTLSMRLVKAQMQNSGVQRADCTQPYPFFLLCFLISFDYTAPM